MKREKNIYEFFFTWEGGLGRSFPTLRSPPARFLTFRRSKETTVTSTLGVFPGICAHCALFTHTCSRMGSLKSEGGSGYSSRYDLAYWAGDTIFFFKKGDVDHFSLPECVGVLFFLNQNRTIRFPQFYCRWYRYWQDSILWVEHEVNSRKREDKRNRLWPSDQILSSPDLHSE